MSDFNNKICALMNDAGAKVYKAKRLGKWLHIDTTKTDEMKVRHLLAKMGAKEIVAPKPCADGRHLDGSRHHRIVGVF